MHAAIAPSTAIAITTIGKAASTAYSVPDVEAVAKAHLRAETRKWLRYSQLVTNLLTTSVAGSAPG